VTEDQEEYVYKLWDKTNKKWWSTIKTNTSHWGTRHVAELFMDHPWNEDIEMEVVKFKLTRVDDAEGLDET